ncbi:MAG: hypothetical protein A2086_00925 [Spirochaetes bacterium GWD1_27_9]|nr:MAG: hypothetical protein A2Z98_03870 [Spirochaetes bacterium GWB1_27_13]OHD24218.1 MAG: hypothetical protein A2Y34_02555 [Spirochaetes bacterium GWC1_27_15]OHD33615.1 MAG: hypothetical protein A2086_00925 [Spirochaetes bacterium GWD1_27_9]
MQEHPIRSLIKAFSWRIAGSLATLVISYVLTKKIDVALIIGAGDFVAKIILFFVHERLWDKIPFGKKKGAPPEYNI